MDDNTDLKGSMMIGAEAVSNKDNAREFPSQFPILSKYNSVNMYVCVCVLMYRITADLKVKTEIITVSLIG
jgi:hypothetical protein